MSRFYNMGEVYDKMAPIMTPQYKFFHLQMLNLITVNLDINDEFFVLDLGAGSGIFLEKVLEKYPQAKCYWLDFSEDFLNVAQKRLSRFENRVVFVQSSFQDHFEDQINNQIDFIFSMSAIHHLKNENKKNLYKKCFNLLKPSGWFFNTDEMITINEDAHQSALAFWVNYVQKQNNLNQNNELFKQYADEWMLRFNAWKSRNINFNGEKKEGDDMHESFIKQMDWLKEIGFKNVDLFVKYHLWCLIGGQK